MFLKLSQKSFVKYKPDSYLFSFFKNNFRSDLVINNSAASILELCSGTNSLKDIVNIIGEKYDSSHEIIKANVEDFLKPFIDCKLVEYSSNKKMQDIVRGSSDIYYPDALIWEITDYCPLKCRHCYLPDKNNFILSKEDIDKIIKIIDKSGVSQVQITGGEALTHPLLEYIVSNLISRGIVLSISTSGFILNDKILKCLSKIKNVVGSGVRVSLDGNKQTHNYIRNNKFAYDKAIKFIKTITSSGITCQIGTTVINQPKSELEELIIKAKKWGVSLVELGAVMTVGNAAKNNLTHQIEHKDFTKFLKELDDKYSDKNFSVKQHNQTEYGRCVAGHKIIRIKANLDVTPCPMTELIMGNLHTQSIEEIMSKYGSFFHDFTAPCSKHCKNCENEHICRNCMAQGLSLKNKVKKCNWFENQKVVLNDFNV